MAASARAAYGEGEPAVPDVGSNASAATTRTFVALDVHRNAIAAAIVPAEGGQPELVQVVNEEKAVRRFVRRLGDPGRVAVCSTGC